jgi:hypothetical protein
MIQRTIHLKENSKIGIGKSLTDSVLTTYYGPKKM